MQHPRPQKVGLYRDLSFAIFTMACLVFPAISVADSASGIVRVIGFTDQSHGSAVEWLKENGWNFRLDAEALNPRFTEKGLVLSTEQRTAGLIERRLRLSDVGRIRITWGVDDYPKGADWENGVYRVPIAVMISFGEEDIGSGSLFVPNTPYFISLFLSKNAQPGKAYTAKYYQKGGRYFCTPCTPPEGKTVITEFDLDDAFRDQFGKSDVPAITSFGIQMNTKDTRGGARAHLERIEFIAR